MKNNANNDFVGLKKLNLVPQGRNCKSCKPLISIFASKNMSQLIKNIPNRAVLTNK